MTQALREGLLAPFLGLSEVGGCRDFRGVPFAVLEELIDRNFVELDGWNDCPGVAAAFLPFLRNHPEYTAHGYVVSWGRPDTRVSIEGIEKAAELTKEEIIDFVRTFAGADELLLSSDYARCWYD